MAFSRRSASGPMTPMITRDAPRLICASSPNSRTRVTIRWICSSVALGWVITIILFVRDHQNDVSRNFLQAWIQDPKITRPFCRIELREGFGRFSLKGEEASEGFIVSKSGERLSLILSPPAGTAENARCQYVAGLRTLGCEWLRFRQLDEEFRSRG